LAEIFVKVVKEAVEKPHQSQLARQNKEHDLGVVITSLFKDEERPVATVARLE
jgi:hypothetical protein